MILLPNRGYSCRHAAIYRALPNFLFTITWARRKLPVIGLLWLLTAGLPVYAQPTIEWDRDLGEEEQFRSLHQTSDGGYILGGSSESGINGGKTQASRGGEDYWLVKLDAQGNKAWDKRFGGGSSDRLHSVQELREGGYIVGGLSTSGSSGDKSEGHFCDSEEELPDVVWALKLNAAGNKQWDRSYGRCYDKEIGFFHILDRMAGIFLLIF